MTHRSVEVKQLVLVQLAQELWQRRPYVWADSPACVGRFNRMCGPMQPYVLFLTNDGEAVAQGQDDALHARVGSHEVVEMAYALRLRILAGGLVWGVGGVDDVTVPESVVGQDKGAGAHVRQQGFVVVGVVALVGIDKGEVEGAKRGQQRQGVADVEVDLVGPGRPFEPWPREVLLLVVDLYGVQLSPRLECAGHTKGAVAGESAQLDDAPRPCHVNEHRQQAALQMAAGHARVVQVQVRGAPEPVQILRLRVDVCEDVGG